MSTRDIQFPGTRVRVRRDGGPFGNPAKLKVQLNFKELFKTTDTSTTFWQQSWP